MLLPLLANESQEDFRLVNGVLRDIVSYEARGAERNIQSFYEQTKVCCSV